MKKRYAVEVDCPNCALGMERAACEVAGVKDAAVNLMTLKMHVTFEDGADPATIMPEVRKRCRKVDADCDVLL